MIAQSTDHQSPAKLDTRQLDHRYDGIAKVTGRAKYAAEFPTENVAYAYATNDHAAADCRSN